MHQDDDYRFLALQFHLNSEPWLNEQAYSQAYGVQYKELGDPDVAVKLAVPDGESQVLSLLRSRRSCRQFADESIELTTVGRILGGAYAPLQQHMLPTGLEIDGRGVPSAGGLFPLELYIISYNVQGLDDGLFHYNAIAHQLEPIRPGVKVADLKDSLLAQPFLERANLVVLVAAVFERTLGKYGPRGYRYILLEAGHLGQSICLLALESKLDSLCVGGFMDADLNAALGLDGLQEAIVYCVGVGNSGDEW